MHRKISDYRISKEEFNMDDYYRKLYKYSEDNGVLYAHLFAKDSPLFYDSSNIGGSCTNFVSQCIWAAYGGYIPYNDKLTIKNINSKVRMVPGVWYGNNDGTTKAWSNVESFYNFVTDKNKEAGPMAISYGDSYIEKIPLAKIKVGDVLQFKSKSQNRYHHSAYVTDVGSSSYYDEIYLCQHSPNIENRPLLEILDSFGGYDDALVRGLHFKDANFYK